MTTTEISVLQRNQIYNVDCTAFMKKLHTDNIQVDIIVTSPPYNIGKKYNVYNDNKNPKDFLNWIREDVAKPSFSILKDDGSFFLNIGGRPSDPLFPQQVLFEFIAAGYKLQNNIIWVKSISIPTANTKNESGINNYNSIGQYQPVNSTLYLNNLHENIYHLTKTGQVELDKGVKVPYQDKSNIDRWKGTNGKDGRDIGNIWFLPYETIQQHRTHPSVFPIELPEMCIKTHGIKQQEQDRNKMLVYDPFMGIGTTALTCLRLGVDYLGTEIDPEYCRIASMALEQKTLL